MAIQNYHQLTACFFVEKFIIRTCVSMAHSQASIKGETLHDLGMYIDASQYTMSRIFYCSHSLLRAGITLSLLNPWGTLLAY